MGSKQLYVGGALLASLLAASAVNAADSISIIADPATTGHRR